MPGGIKEILQRFRQVVAVEGNWSDRPEDPLIDATNRRYSALAMLLRARYLVDVDCWTETRGRPIKPGSICRVPVTSTDYYPTFLEAAGLPAVPEPGYTRPVTVPVSRPARGMATA
jgi:hypothetical protein